MYEHSIIRTSVVTSITPYHIHDTFYDYVRYRIGVNCKCTGEGGMESRSNEPRGYALFILHSCFPYFPIDELCNFSSPLHQSDEFFPCRFPGKKLYLLIITHVFARTQLRSVKRSSGEGIDINFNGSVFYAIRRELFSSRMVFERIARLEFKKETLNSMPAPMWYFKGSRVFFIRSTSGNRGLVTSRGATRINGRWWAEREENSRRMTSCRRLPLHRSLARV